MLCGESECGGQFFKEFFMTAPCPTASEEETLQQTLHTLIRDDAQLASSAHAQEKGKSDEDEERIPRGSGGDWDLSEEEKKIYLKINERVREELCGVREKRMEIKEEEREVLECLQSLILRIFRCV
jgi:hypothetical protein